MSSEKELGPVTPENSPVSTPVVPLSDYVVPAQAITNIDSPLTPTPVAISDMGKITDATANPDRADRKSGYPVILNGDHADFEAEWAGKDPKERPDWSLPSMDAKDWAEKFVEVMKGKIMIKKDDLTGTMIGWFANALMRGYDEARAAGATEMQEILAKIKTDVEKQKGDIRNSFEKQIADIYVEAQAKGKLAWAKYGGALVLGIAVGVYFAEFFQTAATAVTP